MEEAIRQTALTSHELHELHALLFPLRRLEMSEGDLVVQATLLWLVFIRYKLSPNDRIPPAVVPPDLCVCHVHVHVHGGTDLNRVKAPAVHVHVHVHVHVRTVPPDLNRVKAAAVIIRHRRRWDGMGWGGVRWGWMGRVGVGWDGIRWDRNRLGRRMG